MCGDDQTAPITINHFLLRQNNIINHSRFFLHNYNCLIMIMSITKCWRLFPNFSHITKLCYSCSNRNYNDCRINQKERRIKLKGHSYSYLKNKLTTLRQETKKTERNNTKYKLNWIKQFLIKIGGWSQVLQKGEKILLPMLQ